MKALYLDANAHIPLNKQALKAMSDSEDFGHPLSPSLIGRNAASIVEQSREKIASLLNINSNQIFFCYSASQAAEWGMEIFCKINNDTRAVVSPVEHYSVYNACSKFFSPDLYFSHNENGIYNEQEKKYSKVVCIHLQNEIGVIQPLEKIKTDYLFSDMSQSLGKIPINLNSFSNVDVAIFGAHKFGGPSGVGFLYLKDPNHWQPFGTGSRYLLDYPGTPNVLGILGTAIALEDALKTIPERINNMIAFKNVLENGLKELNIDIIAENENRCPNTTFIKISNNRAIHMLMLLGQEGIHVGLGSACGGLNNKNPMMQRLNRSCDAYDFMRISQWGNYGEIEAKYFLENFKRLLVQ